jgi:hypothetical protein
MANSEDLLRQIDAKVSGMLVLVLDAYLRQTGIARPRDRSVDKMLADVGIDNRAIAALLGKTERAVQKQLQKERGTKKTAQAKRGGKHAKAGS